VLLTSTPFTPQTNRKNYMETNYFKVINNFDFPQYFDSNTTDVHRSFMRNEYILKTFKSTFPLISFEDNRKVLKLLSVDKSARALYRTINEEFASLTKLQPAFFLEGLNSAERDQVMAEYQRAAKSAAECGDKLKNIANKARIDSLVAIKERDDVFSNLSPFTIVALVTIENVPTSNKVEYIKEDDEIKAKKISKDIVLEYKRNLIREIKANGGKFPEGLNPLM